MAHISQLKRRIGSSDVVVGRLLAVTATGKPTYRTAKVLDYCQLKKGGRFRWEVIVEWETLPNSEATWENLDEMRE